MHGLGSPWVFHFAVKTLSNLNLRHGKRAGEVFLELQTQVGVAHGGAGGERALAAGGVGSHMTHLWVPSAWNSAWHTVGTQEMLC